MERLSKEKIIEHLAFVIAHDGFNIGLGGCSCDLCLAIRNKAEEIKAKEAKEFWEERYGKGVSSR